VLSAHVSILFFFAPLLCPASASRCLWWFQALHKSAFWGHNAMTTFLLQECKVDVNVQDCYGDSALHDAAKFGHEEVLALLLAGGADRTIRNVNGLTPVDVAKLHTKEGCVRRLTNNKL
jgi:cytochrome c peroxidase